MKDLTSKLVAGMVLGSALLAEDVQAQYKGENKPLPSLVGPCLVKAVQAIESGFNPMLIGGAGELGEMQIMPNKWDELTSEIFGRRLDRKDAFNAETNRIVGTYLLTKIERTFANNVSGWDALEEDQRRKFVLASYKSGENTMLIADCQSKLNDLYGTHLDSDGKIGQSSRPVFERYMRDHKLLKSNKEYKGQFSVALYRQICRTWHQKFPDKHSFDIKMPTNPRHEDTLDYAERGNNLAKLYAQNIQNNSRQRFASVAAPVRKDAKYR